MMNAQGAPVASQGRKTTLGVGNIELANMELVGVVNATLSPSERTPDKIRALVSLYQDCDTQGPMEAMLMSQMVTVHKHAMKLMAKASEISSVTSSEAVMNTANKLMRTFTAQVEAFEKLKRGGKQVIKVDHVHVHEGGQAIVGNIQQPMPGGCNCGR
jgi:hypothetical protein